MVRTTEKELRRKVRNKMKYAIAILSLAFLPGCALLKNDYTTYVDGSKAVSKDAAMTSIKCMDIQAEIAKTADAGGKVAGGQNVNNCIVPPLKIEPPKKGWFK
jgi:hypothetical protein